MVQINFLRFWEAFGMWIWRRMEKISWLDKVTNKEVLRRVNEDIGKGNIDGLAMFWDTTDFLHENIAGRMRNKPTRGRRRIQMLHDLANGDGFVTLRLAAENRGLPLHRIKITCASDSAFNVDTVHLRNVWIIFAECCDKGADCHHAHLETPLGTAQPW